MVTPLTTVAAAVGSVTRIEVPNGNGASGKLVYFASKIESVPPTVSCLVGNQSNSNSKPRARALAALKITEVVVAPTATCRCS